MSIWQLISRSKMNVRRCWLLFYVGYSHKRESNLYMTNKNKSNESKYITDFGTSFNETKISGCIHYRILLTNQMKNKTRIFSNGREYLKNRFQMPCKSMSARLAALDSFRKSGSLLESQPFWIILWISGVIICVPFLILIYTLIHFI